MEEPVLDNGIPVDVSDAGPTAEPAAVEVDSAAVGSAPEPAATPWSPPQEEWQEIAGTVRQLAEQFRPVPVEPAAPTLDHYFPSDPATGETTLTLEGLDRMVQDRAEAIVNGRLGQFEPVLNQTVADRGEALINQKFETLAASGDFDRTLARELAEGYASSGIDPNTAIEKAAARAREFAQQQRQAGQDELRQTLGNIGSAPREPGVNGAGVASEERLPVGHPDRYKQVTDNWVARTKIVS